MELNLTPIPIKIKGSPPTNRRGSWRSILSCIGLTTMMACAATQQVASTPMSTTCSNAPSVEECHAAAAEIEDKCLRECVLLQCSGAKVTCSDYIEQKCLASSRSGKGVGGYVFRSTQTCEIPKSEIYWCDLPLSRKCRAQAMVHELAHSCGWRHGDGKSVPANNGELRCK